MSGNNFAAPAKATVLDAMMNDLGNNRIEELVQDDDQQSRNKPAPSFNTSSGANLTRSRNGAARCNGPAQKWNSAVADGFNDDDAAGVSGLDPLDNGNAHRLSSGQFRSDKILTFDTNRTSKRPKYDPSQPTYRKGTPKAHPNIDRSPNGTSRYPNASNGNPHVSSLGGIVPDGGEVRRWDSGRLLNATLHIDNPILNRPAGRGRPVPDQTGSPSGHPAQTAGSGHGRSGRLPNPLHLNGNSQDAPTQQPQEGVGRGRGILAQAQLFQMSNTTTIGPRGLEAQDSSIRDASWVPPHLRRAGQSPASQSPVISRQASPQSNNKIPTLDAREVFLQEDVLVLPQCVGNKPVKGKIVVYELLDEPVGIWELIIEDEQKVIRGNLRELLEVLSDGSRAFLRRANGGRVVSDPLRFSTVDETKSFMNEVNLRRDQFSRSSGTVYTETTIEWPVQNGAPRKTTSEPTETVTHGTAVESAETSGQKTSELSFDLLQSTQPELDIPSSEENGLARAASELGQHKVESRPHTPPISLPTVEAESTPTKVAAGSHMRTGSGGSDGNLISFSPVKDHKPSRSDELLRGIPVNYEILKRMCNLLYHTVETHHPLHSNPAYMASFLHLLERDEFMAQSPDDRKTSIEALYNNIGGKNARITLSPKVLYALRSKEEACPEAIKELNIRIRGGRYGNWGDPKEPPASQTSTYTSKVMAEKKNTKNLCLCGSSTRDSSVEQLPEGVTTVTPRPASRDLTPSESSSKMSDKPSRGLMGSRWAQDEPEGTEQKSTIRGENVPTRNPSTSPNLNGTGNKPERIIDRKASSHRRSSTNDTMTNLADQLGLLRV
ncbi:hypothetical protein F4801DRAFT_602084 [Xylaria longipes]|nr:hypothetical protein F4801DRAFT_602084 [Xylaria longipes]RYC55059.1 hypothetical protein CHU98_g11150 [Xylaria longipes]